MLVDFFLVFRIDCRFHLGKLKRISLSLARFELSYHRWYCEFRVDFSDHSMNVASLSLSLFSTCLLDNEKNRAICGLLHWHGDLVYRLSLKWRKDNHWSVVDVWLSHIGWQEFVVVQLLWRRERLKQEEIFENLQRVSSKLSQKRIFFFFYFEFHPRHF